MKAEAASDMSIGGPGLASQAIEAGLVDEYHFFVAPVTVGGGKRSSHAIYRVDLELLRASGADGMVPPLPQREPDQAAASDSTSGCGLGSGA